MPVSDNAPETSFEPRIGRSVSIDHAAELLGVSRRTIYNRIRDGRLQTLLTVQPIRSSSDVISSSDGETPSRRRTSDWVRSTTAGAAGYR